MNTRLMCTAFAFFLLAVAGHNVARAQAKEKPILAVLDINDTSRKFSKQSIREAQTYIRNLVMASQAFRIVAGDRQEREQTKWMKKESYKDCYKQQCQIQLGQALSADTIITTRIDYSLGACTLSSRIIRLESEVVVSGGMAEFDCNPPGLKGAIKSVVAQLTGAAAPPQEQAAPVEVARPVVRPAAGAGEVVLFPRQRLKTRASSSDGVVPAGSGGVPVTYYAGNTLDGDLTTAWMEGKKGTGKGEWIQYDFPEDVQLKEIRIWNGYQKTLNDRLKDRYYINERVKEVLVTTASGGTVFRLDDDKAMQRVVLDGSATHYVRLTIRSVYGAKYPDCGLSEVELYVVE